MDKKISQFSVATDVLATDLIPIVSGGINKSVAAGLFSLNLPNIGNKGITKNVVTPIVAGLVIPLTKTLVTLPTALTDYTLGAGTPGQEITLVSLAANVKVVPSSALFLSVSMGNGSSLTLIFVGNSWIPKSYHNCTFN